MFREELEKNLHLLAERQNNAYGRKYDTTDILLEYNYNYDPFQIPLHLSHPMPKSLWLKKYTPEVLTPPDAAAQAVFVTGNEVGDLACGLFPGGVEVAWM